MHTQKNRILHSFNKSNFLTTVSLCGFFFLKLPLRACDHELSCTSVQTTHGQMRLVGDRTGGQSGVLVKDGM